MTGKTIGQLARSLGIGVETIRFYERKGLVAQPPKPAQGHRRYGPALARELAFIRQAKALGFTLAEIADLLALLRGGEATCGEVAARCRAKQAAVRARIAELEELDAALERSAATCEACDPACPCPVLENLPDPGCAPREGAATDRRGRQGPGCAPPRKGDTPC